MTTRLRRRLQALETENAALRRAIRVLHRIGDVVRESLEPDPTRYAVLTGVTAGVGLGLNRAALFLLEEGERDVLRGVAAIGPDTPDEADRVWKAIESAEPNLEELYQAGLAASGRSGLLDQRVRALEVPIAADNVVSRALRSGGLARAAQCPADGLGGLVHRPTGIAAPLRGRDRVRGVLYADNLFTERPVDGITALVFALVADDAGRAIERARRFAEVAEHARTDALTGLENHGAMMEATARAVGAMRACSEPLGLGMLDLDDFKLVNDTLGHLAGDALLAGVADRLRGALRADERPFRYGGEEFAVLLPRLGASELRAVGERLRRAVARGPFPLDVGTAQAITCSVGLAVLHPTARGEEGACARALLAAADGALLAAKRAGKDRVELAPEVEGCAPPQTTPASRAGS